MSNNVQVYFVLYLNSKQFDICFEMNILNFIIE